MRKAYHVDIAHQIEQLKAMIDFNERKAGEHIESPIERRSMTDDQYMKLLKRTAIMRQAIKDIEALQK